LLQTLVSRDRITNWPPMYLVAKIEDRQSLVQSPFRKQMECNERGMAEGNRTSMWVDKKTTET